ncbi:MAG TPA: 6,7-dimethyl-8-ribityllumazine synthase [Saprospiraceae bacterium]|nr:6,7-dimethyl-8-ribityllumazine synthase [Saprospiraceae bacterium]HQW25580.1 6,7-dimethyl-8-ribityllumazine synthase [Saprospiraceae bacterium]
MASRDASPSLVNLPDGSSFKIGIVVSEWNADITNALLEGAKETLLKAGVLEDNIEVLYVPGSFELPWGARQIMKPGKRDAVICLGCIIQGETKHDEYIASAVASGIMQLGLMSGIPVIFGVLTTNTEEQAKDRAGGKHGNKGSEAAVAALQMAIVRTGDTTTKKRIGY